MVWLLFWRAESRGFIAFLGTFSRPVGDWPGLQRNCRAERSDGIQSGWAHAPHRAAPASHRPHELVTRDNCGIGGDLGRVDLFGGLPQSVDRMAYVPHFTGLSCSLHASETRLADLHFRRSFSWSYARSSGLDGRTRTTGMGHVNFVCHFVCMAVPAFLFHRMALPGGLRGGWNSYAAGGRRRWTIHRPAHRSLFADLDPVERFAQCFRDGGQDLHGGSHRPWDCAFLFWCASCVSKVTAQQSALEAVCASGFASHRYLSSALVCLDDE